MTRLFFTITAAGLMLVSGPALAGDLPGSATGETSVWDRQVEPGTEPGWEPDLGRQQEALPDTMTSRVVTAREVIGMDVATVEGREIGSIEEIVYDAMGRHYLVVSSGGFLGIGAEERLVPMEQVIYNDEVLIVMSEDELMEGYDPKTYIPVEPDFEMITGY